MKRMKCLGAGALALLAVLLCLIVSTPAAEARTPLRLARLPVIIETAYAPQGADEVIETQMDRALHVPLNGTLHAVEEIDTAQAEQALREALAELRTQGKHVRYKDAMPLVAEKLDADLVVCPVLTDCREYVYYGGCGPFDCMDETCLESTVALEIDGYDSAEQKNISKSTRRFYRDAYSTQGTALALTEDAASALVRETDLNARVMRALKAEQTSAAS